MTAKTITYLFLLLSTSVYSKSIYSKDFNVDTSLVDKVILTVEEHHGCSHWLYRYCISEKNEIRAVIKSYLRGEPSDIPFGFADSIITFVTKDKNNYSKFDRYFLPKSQPDSILRHYLDLVVSKPNWYQFEIVSDRYDLFDTTLNYIKANYDMDSTYGDRRELISHRIRFQTKDFIKMSDKYKFTDLLEHLDQNPPCVFPKNRGTTQWQFYNKGTGYIPKADIYFPCRNMYDVAEVMNYLHSINGIKIEDVEIKVNFKIKFWVERDRNTNSITEIRTKMEAAGITFSESEIHFVFED
ncbi:MAG: hypothetical protein LBB74_06240 [Chitinispirillales bacterium]|nr:hypothetical protein [Chitinispirillales bacterium]